MTNTLILPSGGEIVGPGVMHSEVRGLASRPQLVSFTAGPETHPDPSGRCSLYFSQQQTWEMAPEKVTKKSLH